MIADRSDDDEGESEGMTSLSAMRCWMSKGTDCAVEVEADRRRR